MTGPILVTGATGTQGGAVARRLLAAGIPVRALVRDPATPRARELAAAGAGLVTADLDDPASLAPAVRGAAGLFVATISPFSDGGPIDDREVARVLGVVDEAARAAVSHVVFSGVAAMGESPQPAKSRIEAGLRVRVPRATVLRPVRFMSNYLATGLPVDGVDDGVHHHLFPPEAPVQIVAPEDIAEFAALAFADPDRYGGRTLDLAGDALSMVDAAAAITEATGTRLRYVQLTADEARALGGPALVEARAFLVGGARWHADVEALRVIHPGLRTLQDWLDEGAADRLRDHLRGQEAAARG